MIDRRSILPRLRAALGRAAALTIIAAGLVGVCGIQAGAAGSQATTGGQREYLIKAAFLYDLIKTTGWPSGPSSHTVQICVVGSDPFGAAWRSIEGKPVGSRKLHIEARDSGQSFSDCNVLFIGDSEQGRVSQIIVGLGRSPILTVSEIAGFAKVGGIIRLMNVDNRLHFKVNLAAAHQAGLVISTEALKLADSVQIEAGSAE